MDRGRLGGEGLENILQSRTDMIHGGFGDRLRPMPGYSDGEHERHRGRMLSHPPRGFQLTIRRADGSSYYSGPVLPPLVMIGSY